jgi:O-succinylbenzoate synthase
LELRRIVVYEVWMTLRSEFRTSFGATRERPALIVRVEERGGEEGWGEVVAGEGPWYSYETYETAWLILDKYLAPALVRAGRVESPSDAMRLFSRVRGHNMAKAGLEEALWDLEAKLRGLPLWRLIGGVRDRIESGVSIGIQGSLEELVKVVSRYLDEGYKRIKIKIEPGWDVEPVRALRREFPDTPLQVDANAAYTLRDLRVFLELDKYELLMIEQPLHYDDLIDHAELARHLRTPICLDESIRGLRDAVAAFKLGSAHVINIKPGRVGGISESLRIHDFWGRLLGRPLWIGGMLETGVGRGHLVALATLPAVSYPNDISASSRYYDEDIVEPPWELERDGTIAAPSSPGIGREVVVERVERLSRRTREYRVERG